MNKLFTIVLFSTFLAGVDFNSELTDSLHARASRNIERLEPSLRIQYEDLLQEYPDALMAFLIQAENSGILADANPLHFVNHWHSIRELPEMNSSAEFFLAYVAKITVGHEAVSDYRRVFRDEGLLQLIDEYPKLEDRVRAANLWARENMTFVSTSGRTQDPVSILKKSNIGRCGEMQTFFIAICRTLGIPSRPAWTPWWAHTDNNHAWAEVFVNGAWHYTGSAEPDYHLDNTWFSGSVQKTLFVLARSSFPDSTDIVLNASPRMSTVNSTPAYHTTRKIHFRVLENGEGVESNLGFFTYNFAMFRALVSVSTDSLGYTDIDIGTGAFMVIAEKDSLYDWQFFSFDSTAAEQWVELHLHDGNWNWESRDFVLDYPVIKHKNQDNPEDYKAYRKEFEERYKLRMKETAAIAIPDFAPKDSNFKVIFKKARGNTKPLIEFLHLHQDIAIDFWKRIQTVDKKFTWEANYQQWAMLFAQYDFLRNDNPEDWENLIEPSVFYEELPETPMHENYIQFRSRPKDQRLAAVMEFLHSKHIIDADSALSGLMSREALVSSKFLADFQFKTLSCYSLRANGIPAQYTRVPGTIMVYADSIWQNYDVANQKFSAGENDDGEEANSTSLEFFLRNSDGQAQTLKDDNIAVTIFQDGRFYFNDRQLEYDAETSALSGELLPGAYQLQLGYRESTERSHVKFHSIQVVDEAIVDTLIFRGINQNWKPANKKFEAIFAALIDSSQSALILLGDYDYEPAQRRADAVQAIDIDFYWLGEKTAPIAISNYSSVAGRLSEFPELRNRVISFYYKADEKRTYFYEGNWDLLKQ